MRALPWRVWRASGRCSPPAARRTSRRRPTRPGPRRQPPSSPRLTAAPWRRSTPTPSPASSSVSPASSLFTEGANRAPFAVFTVGREQITDAEVAIYAAPGPSGPAQGPFPARVESLATEPAFVARSTAADPDAGKAVYVTELEFDRPGEWRVGRTGSPAMRRRLPSECRASRSVAATRSPRPATRLRRVHTPTAEDVGGDLSRDRHPRPTEHDARARPRRGARQAAGGPGDGHPRAVSEPHLRPLGRHRRAGEARPRRRCRVHPHGDLREQRSQRRPPPPGRVPTTCAPSRGSSSSIARAESTPASRVRSASTSSRPRSSGSPSSARDPRSGYDRRERSGRSRGAGQWQATRLGDGGVGVDRRAGDGRRRHRRQATEDRAPIRPPSPADTNGTAEARCPQGTKAVSGGFETEFDSEPGGPFLEVRESRKAGRRGWTGSASNSRD